MKFSKCTAPSFAPNASPSLTHLSNSGLNSFHSSLYICSHSPLLVLSVPALRGLINAMIQQYGKDTQYNQSEQQRTLDSGSAESKQKRIPSNSKDMAYAFLICARVFNKEISTQLVKTNSPQKSAIKQHWPPRNKQDRTVQLLKKGSTNKKIGWLAAK